MDGCNLQEEVVKLEANVEEDEDAESRAKARVGPVVGGVGLVVLGDVDGCPSPPSSLESDNGPECASGSGL